MAGQRVSIESVLIGSGTLPVRCALVLQQAGHRVQRVVSPDAPLREWARTHGIPHAELDVDLAAYLSREPFDYLFSIVNPRILPDEVLALPGRGAINYHDAPLPRYAGTHATSWALINRETRHAVTWHTMRATVDAGAILQQVAVDMAPEETALTLNAKCYEAALEAFIDLVAQLSTDCLAPRKQDLRHRTYFARHKRPPAAATIDWTQSAAEIDALARALDFGPYANPLGMPKLATGQDWLLVEELGVSPAAPAAAPGIITKIDPAYIAVATGSGEVVLRRLATGRGQSLALVEAVARYGWHEGDRLPRLRPDTTARIDALNRAAARAESFWRERLASLKPAGLPYAQGEAPARPASQDSFATLRVPLPEAVKDFLAARDWDRQMFLPAALAVFIGRLHNEPVVDLGFMEAALDEELAGLDTLFARQVPLRLAWHEEGTMTDVLAALATERTTLRRQKTYARDIVRRQPSLRQASVALPIAVLLSRDGTPITPEPDTVLILDLDPTTEEIAWRYRPDVVDRPLLEAMGRQFVAFLEALTMTPERPLKTLPLLAAADQVRLEDFNQTRQPTAPIRCLHELFAEQATRTPEAIAVVCEEQTLTYRALDARANQVAHRLRALGVAPEVIVGILMERSLEMVVAVLGVLKVGGAYLPLSPLFPRDRLDFILADAQAPILLTQTNLAGSVCPGAIRILCLDEEETHDEPGDPLCGSVRPEQLAYVIYTSGSTGQPKGVLIEHRHISAYVGAMRQTYGLSGPASYAMVQPLAVDSSQTVLFPPLISGGTLHIIPEACASDADGLATYMDRHAVEVLKIAPSHLRALQAASATPALLLPSRCLIIGGEASDRAWAEALAATAPCRVFNHYGPTETTVGVLTYPVRPGHDGPATTTLPIGRPFPNTTAYLLDAHQKPVPLGVPGELYIGGAGVARGYLNRPALTADTFMADPFSREPDARLYRTGDLARLLLDVDDQPVAEFLGRMDDQVKIRGYRIELGEIETILNRQPDVRTTLVLTKKNKRGQAELVAYVVPEPAGDTAASPLRDRLQGDLPDYMIPGTFVWLDALPRTPHGKVDRRALPDPDTVPPPEEATGPGPATRAEQAVAGIWQEILERTCVGLDDTFFDLGGDSLLLIQVLSHLRTRFPDADLSIVDLFQHPTVRLLAHRLQPDAVRPQPEAPKAANTATATENVIAIVGMAGRFPGAPDAAAFWANIQDGVESIRRFTEAELTEAGVHPALVHDPCYVGAAGVTAEADRFDATFFGYTPREASIMDPQQRLFLETAWQALEDAGYDPARYAKKIGVFAGVGRNQYLVKNLYSNPDLVALMGNRQIGISNDKDFLTTRVSYKLGLRGPSVNVQTACSTSLVAVHLARQSLLSGDCDMALAGGVTLITQAQGYLYKEGEILAPDGRCRPFDARAQGTVPGSGVGLVVLKRYADALKDGDTIHALILGSAVNNDAAMKVGYTAPSVSGQAEVITDALTQAGVDPATIDYVEAHGTATGLGDPIEVQGLTQAYRRFTDRKQYCAIGSVKSNIGHADTAAGVAGLIKTTLALKHRLLPPSLHYEQANPEIAFNRSPFYVNTTPTPWPAGAHSPRRAGVSSFGIGGTNAHVVLEEAPPRLPAAPGRARHLLCLSAKTEAALDRHTANLAAYLRANGEEALADVAYTLHVGRAALPHRRLLVCRDALDAAEALDGGDPARVHTGSAPATSERPVVFLFTGQGAQYVNMARELYEEEPVFRHHVDHCCGLLREHLGFDLRRYLYPAADADLEAADEQLRRTIITQPTLFVVAYALAQLWKAWGVVPQAMIGHSIGEYVAACLAGVLRLEDALALVAKRGRLMQSLPEGSMLAVFVPEADLRPLLGDDLALAAVNAPRLSVVSGTTASIDRLAATLAERQIDTRTLRTSHAFHSAMMEPILEAFTDEVATKTLRPPRIPFVSNVTGTWIREDEATDPGYWARHLRQSVRFADGVQTLLSLDDPILLEVGPGRTLRDLVQQSNPEATTVVLHALRHPRDPQSDYHHLLTVLGRLWMAGVAIDWAGFYAGMSRRRIPLPTYPFDRQRHWIEPGQATASAAGTPPSLPATREPDADEPDAAVPSRRPSTPRPVWFDSEQERRIAEIWSALMGIEQVGSHDNFFDLGGHSLLAGQILARVRETFGVTIPLRALFETPTVAGFARLVEALLDETDAAACMTYEEELRF